METVLMVVTLVSLALAVGMSLLAWRLLREDQQRSHARSDALREMAAADEIPSTRTGDDGDAEAEWDTPRAPAARQVIERPRSARPEVFASAPEPMFDATDERGAPGRRWAALAAVAVIMLGAAGAVYVLSRPEITDAIPGLRDRATALSPVARPLELLSLRHEAGPDGSFNVTGLVQNPVDGRLARHVIAVVYVFDADGNYFASGKAALDFTALQPGEESPFVVHIPNVGRVTRYRVGFRSEEGGVVAHVDRRGQLDRKSVV